MKLQFLQISNLIKITMHRNVREYKPELYQCQDCIGNLFVVHRHKTKPKGWNIRSAFFSPLGVHVNAHRSDEDQTLNDLFCIGGDAEKICSIA